MQRRGPEGGQQRDPRHLHGQGEARSMVRTLPATVSSWPTRTARPFATCTSRGPRRWRPGTAPVAPMASVISTRRQVRRLATSEIKAGWMWTPSAMISRDTRSSPERRPPARAGGGGWGPWR